MRPRWIFLLLALNIIYIFIGAVCFSYLEYDHDQETTPTDELGTNIEDLIIGVLQQLTGELLIISNPYPFRTKWYCHCLPIRPFVRKLELVRTMIRQRLDLWNNQTCITGYSQLVFKIGVIDLGILAFWLRILWNPICPRDNSSQILVGITKFAPNIHPGILSAQIENESHGLWPSMSFWPFWLRNLGYLACLCDSF